MSFDPFDKVDCKYGSPMGRMSHGSLDDVPSERIETRRAKGTDGDYDEGGAYWGGPIVNVWAVWDRDDAVGTVQYVRADKREEAIARARGEIGEYVFKPRARNEFHSEAAAVAGSQLDAFTAAYVEAIYFTDGQGIDEDEFGPDDMLSAFAARSIKADCDRFCRQNADLLAKAYRNGYDRAQAGYDFWLTRNRSGAGFWDRKELDTSMGQGRTLGEMLSEAARGFGRAYAFLGEDGMVRLEAD